jgi:alkylation response protein AidB-like acyl-CoA dehydrogenase
MTQPTDGPGVALAALRAALTQAGREQGAAPVLHTLIEAGLDQLESPGGGRTLRRWAALAAVAEHDLSLAKLYEGHTDALAILRELGELRAAGGASQMWAVWAAEAPRGRTLIRTEEDGGIRLEGSKCWCSGAADVTHGLLTAWHEDGRGPQLVSVTMAQPGIAVSSDAWHAVGMAGSASLNVSFHGAHARLVGSEGQYLVRAGFWHGGAGVAACWYGGAKALGESLRQAVMRSGAASAHAFRLAALGKVELALAQTAALLREAAAWIDANPRQDASAVALRARLAAEQCAATVQDECGRALGAAAYCLDADFARRAADLPVFIRQSHGERDFAALGSKVAAGAESAWAL